MAITNSFQLESSLLIVILPISGLTKKRQYSETGGEVSHIILPKTIFWDLKMGSDIGGVGAGEQRAVWHGGGGGK